MSRYSALDFRLMAMSQFPVLALLCRIAAWTINDTLNQFLAQQMVNSQAQSRQIFDSQATALIQQMQTTTVADVKYIDKLVSMIVSENHIMSALNTNYYIIKTLPPSVINYFHGHYLISSDSFTNSNRSITSYCTCSETSNCTFQAGFYNYSMRPVSQNRVQPIYLPVPPPLFTVPGMLVGCVPRDSMLQSTLECFYSRSCLDLIGVSQMVAPLNATAASRFPVHLTVNIMFDQLLVESWQNSIDFVGYYTACAPRSCSYTYVQHSNGLYVMTTLLSLAGGLTAALYFLIPLLVNFFRHLQAKCRGDPPPPTDNTCPSE